MYFCTHDAAAARRTAIGERLVQTTSSLRRLRVTVSSAPGSGSN